MGDIGWVHTCVQKLYRGHKGDTVAKQPTALLTAASHFQKEKKILLGDYKNNPRRLKKNNQYSIMPQNWKLEQRPRFICRLFFRLRSIFRVISDFIFITSYETKKDLRFSFHWKEDRDPERLHSSFIVHTPFKPSCRYLCPVISPTLLFLEQTWLCQGSRESTVTSTGARWRIS